VREVLVGWMRTNIYMLLYVFAFFAIDLLEKDEIDGRFILYF
jgi:hypothetical protein